MSVHWVRFCAGAVICACIGLGSADAAAVEHVHVELASVQGAMPQLVQKRIAASLETVGNHVFIGHDDSEIAGSLTGYEVAVNDIMNRVLVGYTVEELHIQPGAETIMTVRIRPWGDTIQSVHVDFDYGGLPPLGAGLAARDVEGVEKQIENLLFGLPADALDWADGAVKAVIEEELERRLPEFYPHILIQGGTRTTVQVYFAPKLPVVRNVYVNVESEHVPKVIFLSTRKHMEERYSGLDGLPVAFLQRHAEGVTQDIASELSRQWVIRQYKLNVTPNLEAAENTVIHLLSQTDFYDIQAAVYMDIGRNKDNTQHDETVLTALLGRKIGSRHEIYGRLEFMPSSVDWNLMPGYFYRTSHGMQAGYQFESIDDSHHLWLRQPLGRHWKLRLDRDLTHHDNEVGLIYRIHDYVGVEYVVSDHDHWLRIIGYL